MSRLEILAPTKAQLIVEDLYKNLERRITASPPGLCPVDITRAFIEMSHSQTCGKCVPCRVGLLQLKHMLTDVLNGDADMDTLDLIEDTAKSFEGVLSAYALQAGRELRVIVEPEKVDDESAVILLAKIKDKISEKIDRTVPVKITLIRERRFTV